jgi:hypothetical protein
MTGEWQLRRKSQARSTSPPLKTLYGGSSSTTTTITTLSTV